MISLDNVYLQFTGREIFKGVSFMATEKDKIGLVGKNGAGKTTLLRVILGQQIPDSGQVTSSPDTSMGHLPQEIRSSSDKTVYEEAKTAYQHILDMEKRIEHINHELSTREDYESDSYLMLIDRLTELNERFTILGGNKFEENIEKTLLGLGFERLDFQRPLTEFSGGWRMRVELAKILLQGPDVLLLDEPTNHLDIESIQWLEEFLSNYRGTVILISHDRAFLNNVTNRTIEITLGKIHDYPVPYSKYLVQREERRQLELASYRNQQKTIEDTQNFIDRFRYKASKADQVQSRIKQLEKMDRIEIEEEDTSAINIRFPDAPRAGSIVVEAEELSKAYGDHLVLNQIDMTIERGERIAFVGKNGEGKTTLSKIIVGDLDHSGKLKIGHNVQIGYFAQNQDTLLDEEKTVLKTIDDVAVGDVRTKIRDILGAFLFSGEDVDKKVKVLSGGEKSRLAMTQLLLKSNNLLVLDEPTNHLDMRSKDILKNALLNYNGTLIVVSHDREFLDGLTNRLYEFRNKKIKEFRGNIFEFLEKKKMQSLQDLERKTTEAKSKPEEAVSTSAENKRDYEEKKRMDRDIRKAQNRVNASEEKIGELEEQLSAMDEQMAEPEKQLKNENQEEFFEKYNVLKKQLQDEMWNWEKLSQKLELLKSKRI